MKAKWKKPWIEALESGKYKQGEGLMKYEKEYCCLGVLRQIMHKGSKAVQYATDGISIELLCEDHEKEAGLTHKQQIKLSRMNDDIDYGDHSDVCPKHVNDFKAIAKYIRKHL